jgi:mRNA-degrading endonuclease toxin of MazEF toxin-antitoxin module
LADQPAAVGKLRLFEKIGQLSREDVHKVEEAIKIQLDLK